MGGLTGKLRKVWEISQGKVSRQAPDTWCFGGSGWSNSRKDIPPSSRLVFWTRMLNLLHSVYRTVLFNSLPQLGF